MKIDRVMAFTDENFPFAAFAVGIDGVGSIKNEGEVFVVYDEQGEKLYEILNFYQIQVNYLKEGVENE